MLKKVIAVIFVIIMLFPESVVAYGDNKPEVSAQSAVLYCANTGETVLSVNGSAKLSMASTTKIMTAIIAIEKSSPETVVSVNAEAANVEGSSSGLKEGDRIYLRDLLYCLMLESGNDAANAVAIAISGNLAEFAKLMNKKAAEIGMKNTSFVTPSGLDGEKHYTTAYDMALLTAYALRNKDFVKICSSKAYTVHFVGDDKTVTLYNHNRLLSSYDGCIGVKTGFTKKSGRCLVTAAERDGITMIAVTLHDSDDWDDHVAMLDYGFCEYESVEMKKDFSDYSIHVVSGKTDSVKIGAESSFFVRKKSDGSKNVTVKVYADKFLYAPVKKNDIVGYAECLIDGKIIKTVPVTASENVEVKETAERKNIFERIIDFIKR